MEQWTTDVTTHAFLGDNDRYIDETSCVNYKNIHPQNAGSFNLTVYPAATHTFDHASPNQANIEAGSIYDEKAILDAWQKMKKLILK